MLFRSSISLFISGSFSAAAPAAAPPATAPAAAAFTAAAPAAAAAAAALSPCQPHRRYISSSSALASACPSLLPWPQPSH